jgi:uncharacterized protein (TIGR00299 family) protein
VTVLYFDCFSGASGDMIVGALLDAGVPLEALRTALGSLSIDPEVIWGERVTRGGIRATKFQVRGEDAGHGHAHHVHSGGVATEVRHAHRTLPEIDALVDRSRLSAAGKDRVKALFARLGEAEAAVHGTPVDKVHLHEVGALDSIVDIVSAVHALELIGAHRIVSSPLNVGSGTIRSSHGVLPVPAPATARLLEGVPVYAGTQRSEMVTPTGALLVTAYATEFGGMPPMRIAQTGYGAGARNFDESPNVLRVLIGESDAAASRHHVVVIEAEIDDMNPQIFGVVMDALLAEGALDVFYTPIQMKKNRPGTLLSVIAPPQRRDVLTAIMFRETTTIGVRYSEVARECLDRETTTVETPFGPVRFKVARRGGDILNAAPEFDDCVHLARQHGRPIKEIQAAAIRAFKG